MFGHAYLGGRYFGPRYFGDGGNLAPVVEVDEGGGNDDDYYRPRKKKAKAVAVLVEKQQVKSAIKKALTAKPSQRGMTREQEAQFIRDALAAREIAYKSAYREIYEQVRKDAVAAEIAALMARDMQSMAGELEAARQREIAASIELEYAQRMAEDDELAATILLLM